MFDSFSKQSSEIIGETKDIVSLPYLDWRQELPVQALSFYRLKIK
jgi:hypothetical protein